jgi:hypothetical protein
MSMDVRESHRDETTPNSYFWVIINQCRKIIIKENNKYNTVNK